MPKLATIEKSSNQGLKNKSNYTELIALYNRLDNQQKTEFNQLLVQNEASRKRRWRERK